MQEDDHALVGLTSVNNDWVATAVCQCGEPFTARDLSRKIAENAATIKLKIHIEESK